MKTWPPHPQKYNPPHYTKHDNIVANQKQPQRPTNLQIDPSKQTYITVYPDGTTAQTIFDDSTDSPTPSIQEVDYPYPAYQTKYDPNAPTTTI